MEGDIDLGKCTDNIFVQSINTEVIYDSEGSIQIAYNQFGKGHSIYLSGFKFTQENTRLLHKGLFFAAGRENEYGPWTCSNVYTDCAYYPNTKKLVVINSSDKTEKTKVYDANGKAYDISLKSHGIEIIDL